VSATPGQALAVLRRRNEKLKAEAKRLRDRIRPLEKRLRVVEAEGAEVQRTMQTAERLLSQLRDLCSGVTAPANGASAGSGNGTPEITPATVLAALRGARRWVDCRNLAELMGSDDTEAVSMRLSYLSNGGDVVRRPIAGAAGPNPRYEYAHPDLLSEVARGARAAAGGGGA